MVFFNYATMQMAAKIVYYGPGLCGKTTNLHQIYQKTTPQSRGEMVSLETETDRTLFFDLLPIDVGVIGGFKTRLQLYTVPGQVFYNTTRKLVLKGVDGIVFVADSQLAMLDANADSFRNLQDNLAEIDLSVDDIPLVIQLNKRDLPNIATPDQMLDRLDPARRFEHVESVAASGVGVFDTLKTISKLTIRTLRRRMTHDEPVRLAPKRPIAAIAEFRVQTSAEPPHVAPAAATQDAARGIAPGTPSVISTAVDLLTPPEPEPVIEAEALPPENKFSATGAAFEETPAPFPAASQEDVFPQSTIEIPAVAAEPEIEFAQTEKAAKATPEVKRVKVRSTLDVMAELEALRKNATHLTKPKKDADPVVAKPRRDVQKSMHIVVPADVIGRSKSLRLTVSFLDDQGVLRTEELSVEAGDTSDVQSLSLNVKIDLA